MQRGSALRGPEAVEIQGLIAAKPQKRASSWGGPTWGSAAERKCRARNRLRAVQSGSALRGSSWRDPQPGGVPGASTPSARLTMVPRGVGGWAGVDGGRSGLAGSVGETGGPPACRHVGIETKGECSGTVCEHLLAASHKGWVAPRGIARIHEASHQTLGCCTGGVLTLLASMTRDNHHAKLCSDHQHCHSQLLV